MKHFPRLLALAETHNLPLFLHSRHPDAHKDFVRTLDRAGWKRGRAVGASDSAQEKGRRGVVHSFTGSKEEMEELVGRPAQ
jgi:TatD DNase family protein